MRLDLDIFSFLWLKNFKKIHWYDFSEMVDFAKNESPTFLMYELNDFVVKAMRRILGLFVK